MTDENRPPRAAIVINTKDGRRLKPPCPVCAVKLWSTPKLPMPDRAAEPPNLFGLGGGPYAGGLAAGSTQTVLTAVRGDDLLSLPVLTFICMNCGYVMQIAHNADRSHKVTTDD